MEPKYPISIAPFGEHGYESGYEAQIAINASEVITTRTLVREHKRLCCSFKLVKLVVANGEIMFVVTNYDLNLEPVLAILDGYEFDFAADGEPEPVPQFLYFTPEYKERPDDNSLTIFEPDQPLRAADLMSYMTGLNNRYLSLQVLGDYLVLRDGEHSFRSTFRTAIPVPYRQCGLEARCELWHGSTSIRRIWLRVLDVYDEPDFEQAQKLHGIYLPQFVEDEHLVEAILCLQGIEHRVNVITDLIEGNNIWKVALQFAKSLGYHPHLTEFRLWVDDRRWLTYVPDAESDRS